MPFKNPWAKAFYKSREPHNTSEDNPTVKKAAISSFLASDDDVGVTPDMLVAASQKVLNVRQGLEDQDERDSLAYKRVMSVNDLIGERVRFDSGKVRLNLMRKLANKKSLKNVPAGVFNNYTKGQIISNPLSQASDGVNPLHSLEQLRRITVFGQGGLGSSQALTAEMGSVHPSEFGFISTVETSESEKAGVDIRAAHNTKLGSDGRIYQRFRNPRSGQYHWQSSRDLTDKRVGFDKRYSA